MTTATDRPTKQPVAPSANDERVRLAFDLYERFGKPLESTHVGRFVAITPDGQTLLGDSLLDTVQKATSVFGPGSYVFKVGEGVVGRWR